MNRPMHPDGTPYSIVLLEAGEAEERAVTAEAEFLERLGIERERAIRQGLHEYVRWLDAERELASRPSDPEGRWQVAS